MNIVDTREIVAQWTLRPSQVWMPKQDFEELMRWGKMEDAFQHYCKLRKTGLRQRDALMRTRWKFNFDSCAMADLVDEIVRRKERVDTSGYRKTKMEWFVSN